MKNPYELRYDIYNTAKERLMDKYYQDNGEWSNFQEIIVDFQRNLKYNTCITIRERIRLRRVFNPSNFQSRN